MPQPARAAAGARRDPYKVRGNGTLRRLLSARIAAVAWTHLEKEVTKATSAVGPSQSIRSIVYIRVSDILYSIDVVYRSVCDILSVHV